MNRMLCVSLSSLFLAAGCALPPEEALPIAPVPEKAAALPYADIVVRARLHATSATEAFYLDQWSELEDIAGKLEQSARMLVKSTDVPARHKDKLPQHADELAKQAKGLQQAAKAKDVKLTNTALQQINLKVRELRPGE